MQLPDSAQPATSLPQLLILDDLAEEALNSSEVKDIMISDSHHTNLSIIIV